MADGVLTAAVSVTSAVGGIGESLTSSVSQGCYIICIAVAKPSVANDVVPISIVRLIYSLLPCISHLLSGLFTLPFPLATAGHCTPVVRIRAKCAPYTSFLPTFPSHNIRQLPQSGFSSSQGRAYPTSQSFLASFAPLIRREPSCVITKPWSFPTG